MPRATQSTPSSARWRKFMLAALAALIALLGVSLLTAWPYYRACLRTYDTIRAQHVLLRQYYRGGPQPGSLAELPGSLITHCIEATGVRTQIVSAKAPDYLGNSSLFLARAQPPEDALLLVVGYVKPPPLIAVPGMRLLRILSPPPYQQVDTAIPPQMPSSSAPQLLRDSYDPYNWDCQTYLSSGFEPAALPLRLAALLNQSRGSPSAANECGSPYTVIALD